MLDLNYSVVLRARSAPLISERFINVQYGTNEKAPNTTAFYECNNLGVVSSNTNLKDPLLSSSLLNILFGQELLQAAKHGAKMAHIYSLTALFRS